MEETNKDFSSIFIFTKYYAINFFIICNILAGGITMLLTDRNLNTVPPCLTLLEGNNWGKRVRENEERGKCVWKGRRKVSWEKWRGTGKGWRREKRREGVG